MNKELPIKPLQSFCDDFKQDIVDGPFGSELQRKDYITEGVPVLKIQNVKPFSIELKKMDYVSADKFRELRRHSFRRGDIVMTKLGSPLGVSAIVEDLDEGVIVADLVRIRAQRINTKYLCYHLNSQRTNDFINSMQKGTTRPRVTLSVVRELPIYAPPLTEQQRIVRLLDEAFAGLATAQAHAEKNLQNARALFESHLQSVFTQRGEGWVEKKLGDKSLLEIIDGDRGVNYPKASDFYDDGHCLFLNTKNVRPNGFDFHSKMFITEKKDGQLRKGKLKRDDIVLTTRGTIGNIGLYSDDVPFGHIRINSGMLIFRPNKDVLIPSYLFEILRSEILKDQIKKQTTGAAQPQLPIKTLVNFTIPVPNNLDDQLLVVKKLRAFEPETQRLASIYTQKLALLSALKQSLLHQAFSGEL